MKIHIKKSFFTLIELIAVILILAISSAIVATQLNFNSPKNILDKEVRNIAEIFHDGRIMALNGNLKVAIVSAKDSDGKLLFFLQKDNQIMKKLILDKRLKITPQSENENFRNNVKYEILNSSNYEVFLVWKMHKDGRIAGENFNISLGSLAKRLQVSNLTGVVSLYEVKP